MGQYKEKLVTGVESLIKIMVILICGALFLLSIGSTSRLQGYEENTVYLGDAPLLHLLLTAVVFLFLYWLGKRRRRREGTKWRTFCALAVLFTGAGILGVYWVLHTQFKPLGDSAVVWNIAKQMQAGDYSSFRELGYGERYANQFGIILFMNLVGRLAGFGDNLVLQLINVAALLLFYWSMGRMAEIFWGRKAGLYVVIAFLLFIPFGLYIVFAYGNMLSWAFLAFAMCQTVLLSGTGKLRYGVGMIVGITLSVQFKTFGIIVWIAVVLIGLLEYVRSGKGKLFKYAMLSAAAMYACSFAASAAIDAHLDGYERKPLTFWGHVAMGMQESYMAPGWYNGIHDATYLENGGDREATKALFQDMIRESLGRFAKDPVYALKFYGKKIASAWNNPSFQGFWFGEIGQPSTDEPQWIRSVYGGRIREVLDIYLNYMLTVLYAGILVYLLFGWKKATGVRLLPALAFLGGFLFLLLWETKCQYAIGFFVLLIPYGTEGLSMVYRGSLGGLSLRALPALSLKARSREKR